jgi:hypothetical protein
LTLPTWLTRSRARVIVPSRNEPMMRHALRGVSLAMSAASHVLLAAGVIALAPLRQPASPQTNKEITVTIATIPMSREPAASEAIAEAQKAAGVPNRKS